MMKKPAMAMGHGFRLPVVVFIFFFVFGFRFSRPDKNGLHGLHPPAIGIDTNFQLLGCPVQRGGLQLNQHRGFDEFAGGHKKILIAHDLQLPVRVLQFQLHRQIAHGLVHELEQIEVFDPAVRGQHEH